MSDEQQPSRQLDEKIAALGDWRGDTLALVRRLIHEADPHVVEQMKWAKPTNPAGVPTWEDVGIICTGEVYRAYVKLTFAAGAELDDPSGLFNAGLGGGTRRAIDIREGDHIDGEAFKRLIAAAVARNRRKKGLTDE